MTSDKIAELFEEIIEMKRGQADSEDIEAYGRIERARGVLLAFQTTNPHTEDSDKPDGFTNRLRNAARALKGQPPVADDSLKEVAGLADKTSEYLDDCADDMRDELASRHGTDRDRRMFR